MVCTSVCIHTHTHTHTHTPEYYSAIKKKVIFMCYNMDGALRVLC